MSRCLIVSPGLLSQVSGLPLPLSLHPHINVPAGFPTLMGAGRGWKLVASEDGKTLTLRDVSGSVLLVR